MNKRLFLLAALLAAEGTASAASLDTLRSAVFKINVTSSPPNFNEPWKRTAPTGSSGTGFYIGNGRIMTNAHVVADATFITVLRDGASKPSPARVKFMGHDCDLAILELDDADIVMKDVEPMSIGGLPKLRTPVSTIGFPMGGEQISVTEGVVSRVSYRQYVHSGHADHLLVQVDSAINPGNSGGPVVQGSVVVGVAFQTFRSAENTGYIIPTPVVRRFLKDVEDGRYDGHPEDGLATIEGAMMNPSMAAYFGVTGVEGGVQVTHVAPWAPTSGKIKGGDILLAIDGVPIGVDGKLIFAGERVDFRVLFDLKQMGDQAEFKLVRDGKVETVLVSVQPAKPHHTPSHVYAKHAKFFTWGGLVFTTLTRSFLKTWGDRWYRAAPLALRYFDAYSEYEDEAGEMSDMVVLTKRLPDVVNAYSTGNANSMVIAVDGKPVRSLPDLIAGLENGEGEFAVIDFFGSEDPLVLSRATVKARNAELNAKYGVSPDRWLFGPEVDGAVGMVAGEPASAPSPPGAQPPPVPAGAVPNAGSTPAPADEPQGPGVGS